MNYSAHPLLILVLLFTVACLGNNEYKTIDKSEFVVFGDTPLEHTIYKGTDRNYHYFVWSNGKNSGKWKIKKEAMELGCELVHDENIEHFLAKDEKGVYRPYPCSIGQ